MQAEQRTGRVRRPKTDILPLCHAMIMKYIMMWNTIASAGSVAGDSGAGRNKQPRAHRSTDS